MLLFFVMNFNVVMKRPVNAGMNALMNVAMNAVTNYLENTPLGKCGLFTDSSLYLVQKINFLMPFHHGHG